MKTLHLASFALAALCIATASAQTTGSLNIGASARDGFTRSGTDVLFTRNGVSEKVTKEVILPNGLRVTSDGTVTKINGSRTSLGTNQILTMDGHIQDTPITPSGVAPMPSGGTLPAGSKPELGVSGRDGISMGGNDAYITRSGVTRKISEEIRLESGVRVRPGGKVTLNNGSEINLRPNQVMTLDGLIHEAPVIPQQR